jgi:hypothetical protein
LSEASLREKGYFDPAAVGAKLKRVGREGMNPGGRLMSVLMVQLWDELFIRARPVADLCG